MSISGLQLNLGITQSVDNLLVVRHVHFTVYMYIICSKIYMMTLLLKAGGGGVGRSGESHLKQTGMAGNVELHP